MIRNLLILCAALWATALLFVLHQLAQNGRYQVNPTNGIITDTRTGALYEVDRASGVATPVIKPIE